MADSAGEEIKMESSEANRQPGPSRKRHRERSPRRSLACISCRKIKMKCVGGDEGTGMPCRVSLAVEQSPCFRLASTRDVAASLFSQRCRNHNRECVWVESKRGRRPKSLVPEGADLPSIDRRPSDSTLSPHTTPERLPQPPGIGTHSSQSMFNTHLVGTPMSYSSYATHPSGLRNERPEEQWRERQYEATVSPLMEMVDGNESRQLLESRIRLVERKLLRNLEDHTSRKSSSPCYIPPHRNDWNIFRVFRTIRKRDNARRINTLYPSSIVFGYTPSGSQKPLTIPAVNGT